MFKNIFHIIMTCILFVACNRVDDFDKEEDAALMNFALPTLIGESGAGDLAIDNCRIYLFEAGTDNLVDYFYSHATNVNLNSIKMKGLLNDQRMDLYVLLNFPNEGVNVQNDKNCRTRLDINTTRNELLDAEWLWTETEPNKPIPRVLVKRNVVSSEGTITNPYGLEVPSILAKVSVRIAKVLGNEEKVIVDKITLGNFPNKIYVISRNEAAYPTNALLDEFAKIHVYNETEGVITKNFTTEGVFPADTKELQVCYIPEYLNLGQTFQKPYELIVNYRTETAEGFSLNHANRLVLEAKNTVETPSIITRNKHVQINYSISPANLDSHMHLSLTISDIISHTTDIPNFE